VTGLDVRNAVIAGDAPGTGQDSVGGKIVFAPGHHLNRPGLLLSRGLIYIAFASHCDTDPFHGWIFAYDAATLTRQAVLLTAPDGPPGGTGEGGVWQSGHGLAADSGGNVYFMCGNGIYTGDGRNLGDAFVKLKVTGHAFDVLGWYAPPNFDLLRKMDVDLGSAGPLLVPGTNLVIGGGKEGKLHLLDRTTMTGKVATPLQEFHATLDPLPRVAMPSRPGDIQYWNIHGSPVYYEGPGGQFIYLCGEEEPIKAFRLASATNSAGLEINPTKAVARSDDRPGFPTSRANYPPDTTSAASRVDETWMPGGFLAISANGIKSNTAIIWALMPWNSNANQRVVPGVLRAFDATTFGPARGDGSLLINQIWSSDHDGNTTADALGMYPKFVYPIVANGHVIVPAFNQEDNNHAVIAGGNRAALAVYGIH